VDEEPLGALSKNGEDLDGRIRFDDQTRALGRSGDRTEGLRSPRARCTPACARQVSVIRDGQCATPISRRRSSSSCAAPPATARRYGPSFEPSRTMRASVFDVTARSSRVSRVCARVLRAEYEQVVVGRRTRRARIRDSTRGARECAVDCRIVAERRGPPGRDSAPRPVGPTRRAQPRSAALLRCERSACRASGRRWAPGRRSRRPASRRR